MGRLQCAARMSLEEIQGTDARWGFGDLGWEGLGSSLQLPLTSQGCDFLHMWASASKFRLLGELPCSPQVESWARGRCCWGMRGCPSGKQPWTAQNLPDRQTWPVWLLPAPSTLLQLSHPSLSSKSISRGKGQLSTRTWQALPGKKPNWPTLAWTVLSHQYTQSTQIPQTSDSQPEVRNRRLSSSRERIGPGPPKGNFWSPWDLIFPG